MKKEHTGQKGESAQDKTTFFLLLWEMELAKAHLYDQLTAAYPADGRKWQKLAENKRSDAQRIAALQLDAVEGPPAAAENEELEETLGNTITLIEHLRIRVKKDCPAIDHILQAALAIEEISPDYLLDRYCGSGSRSIRTATTELNLSLRRQQARLFRWLEDLATSAQGKEWPRQYSGRKYAQPGLA